MLAVSWSNKCAPHCHFMGPLLTLMTWSRISKWNISSSCGTDITKGKKYSFKRPLWWVCFNSVYSVNGYLMSSWSVIYGIGIEKGNYSSPYLAPWRTMVYGPWGNHPRVEKKGNNYDKLFFHFPKGTTNVDTPETGLENQWMTSKRIESTKRVCWMGVGSWLNQ